MSTADLPPDVSGREIWYNKTERGESGMGKKRILILTASIGAGHIKAAEAIAAELRELMPEAELTTVDFMASSTSRLHAFMKQFYLKMLAFVPNLYDVFYRLSGEDSGGSVIQGSFSHTMEPAIHSLVDQYDPDLILCTHPFPESAAVYFRTQHESRFLLDVVMTDYCLHRIWLCPGIDHYFMAIPRMREEMIRDGYEPHRLSACGIPVDAHLQDLPSKDDIRRDMQLPKGNPVILLMGGGLGLGGIDATLRELEKLPQQLTFLVIAGRNERLLARVHAIAASSHHHIRVWGYTDEVHRLMRASDLLITKPGALTMGEAFAFGLPLLLHDPIPGPETQNAAYATRHGAAVWLHPGEKISTAVRDLLRGERLSLMRRCCLACAKPQAAKDIAQTIVRQLNELP